MKIIGPVDDICTAKAITTNSGDRTTRPNAEPQMSSNRFEAGIATSRADFWGCAGALIALRAFANGMNTNNLKCNFKVALVITLTALQLRINTYINKILTSM